MSDESEHSKSEFYYPEELTDMELLQLPTDAQREDKKSSAKLLTGEQKGNTVKKTTYDINVVHRFFLECGEKRKLTEITPAELDSLLCNFYISAKKKDNTEYEPDTMSILGNNKNEQDKRKVEQASQLGQSRANKKLRKRSKRNKKIESGC